MTLLGLGMATCEAWGQLHQLGTGETADQWLMGYLSGTAVVAGSNYLSGLAPADLLRRVQEYCKANPRAVLGVAGIEVAKEIRTAAEGKPAGEVAPALPSPAASTPAKPPAR